MDLNIVRLARPRRQPEDWTNIELAEFYRVEASLIRAGLSVETDRGMTDEGHPWFVFCRADAGEVILHLARFDRCYVVASPAFGGCVRGPDFRALVEHLIGAQLLAGPTARGGNVYTHPSAALIALASICFFKLHATEAVAKEAGVKDAAVKDAGAPQWKGAHAPILQAAKLLAPGLAEGRQAFNADGHEDAAIVAAIGMAMLASDASSAAAMAAPTTVAAPSASIAFSSPHHAAPLDGAHWTDQSAPALDAPTYAELTGGNALSAAPIVVVGARPSPPVSGQLESIVPIAADKDANPLHANDLQFSPPGHSLIERIAEASAIGLMAAGNSAASSIAASLSDAGPAASISGDAGPLASTSDFKPPAALTTTGAGQEVISVLGNSLQTHFVASPSAADTELIANIASKPSVAGDLPASPAHATAHSTTSEAPKTTEPSTTTPSPADQAPDGTSHTTGATTTVATSVSSSEIAKATQDVMQFEKDYPGFQVFDIGKEVVIVDVHLTSSNSSSALHETFSFSDGSSILLVGLPTHHAGGFMF